MRSLPPALARALRLLACGAALCLATPALAAEPCARALSVGWDNWPPYHYLSARQQLEGYSVAVLNEAARRAGCQLHYQQMPWPRTLLRLRTGLVDVAMGALKTPERERYALFVPAYNPATVRLWALREQQARWPVHRPEDLAKLSALTLGINRGDSFGGELDAWLQHPPATVTLDQAPTLSTNIQKLRAKRIDLLLANSAAMRAALLAQPGEPAILPLPPVWRVGEAYFAFSKAGVPASVVTAFEQALRGMKQDGTIAELYQRHFDAPFPE